MALGPPFASYVVVALPPEAPISTPGPPLPAMMFELHVVPEYWQMMLPPMSAKIAPRMYSRK